MPRAVVQLLILKLGILISLAAAGALVAGLSDHPTWVRGIWVACGSIFLGIMLTLPIQRRALRPGAPWPIGGLMLAGGLRFIVAVGVALTLVLKQQTPAIPTFMALPPLYLAVLTAETCFLNRLLWNSNAS